MTKSEEAALKAKMERAHREQREVPLGRNFLAWNMRDREPVDVEKYRANFDAIFPDAPGCGI